MGRLVADRLRYRLVDEEIVARAAEKEKLHPGDLADVERRKSLLERVLRDFAAAGEAQAYVPFVPHQDPGSLRTLIRQSINETAEQGNVVIVSHAASYALAGRDDVLRVLVTASASRRATRLAASEGLDEKAAGKSIAAHDAGRADYLKRFYGVGSEEAAHYDIVVNTDSISAANAAGIVVHSASS